MEGGAGGGGRGGVQTLEGSWLGTGRGLAEELRSMWFRRECVLLVSRQVCKQSL